MISINKPKEEKIREAFIASGMTIEINCADVLKKKQLDRR